ncbi:MAG: bifunctional 2-C-methyl-D-erythritol 4-phosphate cytidylyltransferase/2-C-methyl-D-erythritol 2,4-cyclodiphosphate synthase [Rhodobacteraceae bacterium]|nr:bifunctional 2-C-methyl-D-erythritol 4-phosphate cytidylyltransferase/2-C-methyl-D-erythritol 2,4-cyclodiphosphate synthase [Paracoccaceae bacterium]
MQKTSALIVAAGRGTRAGAGILPKQYRMVGGQPVLVRTLRALLAHPAVNDVQVVIHPDDIALYQSAVAGITGLRPPVFGGDTRSGSVLKGLEALAKDAPDFVLIHDAARPFLPLVVIDDLLNALQSAKGAFPALPVVDALWQGEDGHAVAPGDRDGLYGAQTPQSFHFKAILSAHNNATAPADDDVALAVAQGIKVAIVHGSERNYKLTTPADFARAEKETAKMDIRTGNGFDVHAFTEGDAVILCGTKVPHSRALLGHSDADVAMHTITDALFGALAEGDIGQWFPPSEAKWKGAASEIFLRKAVERVAMRGFDICNIDCTIICESPKIGPHASAMRAEIARLCGIGVDRVSIKATTSEKLGFTGREEGIAAMATTTLVKI